MNELLIHAIAVPALIMSGVSLYVGLYHLLIFSRRPLQREHLSFAACCFGLSVYNILCAGLYNADSIGEGVEWQRWQNAWVNVMLLTFIWFISAFTQRKSSRVEPLLWLYLVFCLAVTAANLPPWNVTIADSAPLVLTWPGWFGVTYNEGVTGFGIDVNHLSVLAFYLYYFYAVIAFGRAGNWPKAWPLAVAMAIFFFAVFNDVMVGLKWFHSLYLVEYAYLLLIIAMAYPLSNDILQAAFMKEELEKSEENLSTTLHSIGDAVIATDIEGRVTKMNTVAEELTGWDFPDAEGLSLNDIFPIINEETRMPLENPVREVLATGRIVGLANHTVLLARGGREYPIVDSAAPIRSRRGEITGVVLVFRDQTEERAHKKALQEAHDLLETRVKERTHELLDANRALAEEIEERKSLQQQLIRSEQLAAIGTLAGGVAHEFNNINVSVLGFSEIALEQDELKETTRDFIKKIRQAALRARSISRNLLNFASPARCAHTPADLNQIVRDTISLVEKEFRTEGVEISTNLRELPEILLDSGQIGQVLLNLLTNAKHAMLGREIKSAQVETGVGKDEIYFSVADTGCGIAVEDLSRIFTPFFSRKGEHAGQTPQAAVKGVGLGLSVTNTMVEQHGGKISVESELGRGATFTVRLPLRWPDKPGAAPLVKSPAKIGRAGKVLVLDDEADTRDLLKLMLVKMGYQAFATDSGEDALACVSHDEVRVILMDLQMPLMDGRTFLSRLRALEGIAQPVCLVITGRQTAENFAGLDVFDMVAKPFEFDEIENALDKATKAWEQRQG